LIGVNVIVSELPYYWNFFYSPNFGGLRPYWLDKEHDMLLQSVSPDC